MSATGKHMTRASDDHSLTLEQGIVNFEKDNNRGWLRTLFSNIAFAFSTPRIPGPYVMKGLPRRAIKKAIEDSSGRETGIEIDGDTYVVVPEEKYRKTRRLGDRAPRHHR